MQKKEKLAIGRTYHIFSKSIANFTIFNEARDFIRVQNMMMFYKLKGITHGFSRFMESEKVTSEGFYACFLPVSLCKEPLVRIIAYCSYAYTPTFYFGAIKGRWHINIYG